MDTDTERIEWWAWVQARMDQRGWRASDLADRSGLSHSVISRWSRGTAPGVETVRQVCRALDVPVREGVVAAGILTAEEVGAPDVERRAATPEQLGATPTAALLHELGRRHTIGALAATGS